MRLHVLFKIAGDVLRTNATFEPAWNRFERFERPAWYLPPPRNYEEKMEKIWVSPITKAPTRTEKSKKNKVTTYKTPPKTSSNSSHPTGVVKPVYERPIFPLTAKAV